MQCPNCSRIMRSHGSQTIEGEQDALVIISWGCESCEQIYEEILAGQGSQGMPRRRLLYPVRSIKPTALPPMRGPDRTRRIQTRAPVG